MNNIESLPEDPDPYDFERDQIDYPSLPPGLIPPTSGSRFAPSINTRALLPTIEELSESREPSPTHSSPDAPVIPPGLEGLTLSSTQLMQTRNAEGNQHSFTIHHTSIDSTNGPERHSLSSDITKVSKNEAEGKGEGEFVAVSVHPVEEGTSEAGHNIGEVQVEPSARRVSVIGAESMILGEKDLAPRKSWSFWLPFVAINISIFISAMSFMAIGTVLPTIAHSLDDRRGDFTWIGSAYALSMTAFIPLGGAVSDIFGRKPTLLLSIVCFALGSALAGASHNMAMIITAQTIQGIGGGGMISVTEMIISDLVPPLERSKFQGILGLTWSVASAVAPIIGGAFASNKNVTWRWLFYLNLPLTGVAGALIVIFLHVPHPEGPSLSKLARIDWVGNAMIILGCGLTTIGFAWGGVQSPWSSAQVLAPLLVGFALLISFGLYESRIPKQPIVPPSLFKNRTALSGYLCIATHGIASTAFIFYMPVYFQAVLGHSPVHSAIDFLSSVLVIVTAAFIAGVVVSYAEFHRLPIYTGWGLMMIGFGLLSTLTEASTTGKWVGYQILAGAGAGLLYSTPSLLMLKSLPASRAASALSLSNLVRAFGQTWGITIASTIMQNLLTKSLSSQTITFADIPEISNSPEVRHAFARSIMVIWETMVGVCGVGLLGSLLMKEVKASNRGNLVCALKKCGSPPIRNERSTNRDLERGIPMEARESSGR